VEYPVGHPRRRTEGIPLLLQKFETNVTRQFAEKQRRAIVHLCRNDEQLAAMPVYAFMDLIAS